jgi:hypothetical protein
MIQARGGFFAVVVLVCVQNKGIDPRIWTKEEQVTGPNIPPIRARVRVRVGLGLVIELGLGLGLRWRR